MDSRSHAPTTNIQAIPQELKSFQRWLRWSLTKTSKGALTKKPDRSTLDIGAWSSWADVEPTATQADGTGGVGLVLTGGAKDADGRTLIALDLDSCRNPATGGIAPWAADVIRGFASSYTEISPSGYGLRTFVWIAKDVKSMPIVYVDAEPMDAKKKPQIQVTGTGAACYVTVTGAHLAGLSGEDIQVASGLEWLQNTYQVNETEIHARVKLPEGAGEPPSTEDIGNDIARTARGAMMLEGAWEELGYESASELWWDLARAVLHAARFHGEAAVDFLLFETAFGDGAVDSKDPERYARRSWVLRDVARVASKTHDQDAADAFTGEDAEAGLVAFDAWFEAHKTGKAVQAAEKAAGLLLPFKAWAEEQEGWEFLYKGLIPKRGVIEFFGAPGSGKTIYAISLAVSVATDRDWLGYTLKRAGGDVVYIVGEDAPGIRDRLFAQAMVLDEGIDPAQGDLDRVLLTTRPAELSSEKDVGVWVDAIRSASSKVSLVVVDTLTANFGDGNENATDDMSRVVAQVKRISTAVGATVLLIHHSSKGDPDTDRGSSVLKGALDMQFRVETPSAASRRIIMFTQKAKGVAPPPPLKAEIVSPVVRHDEDGDPVTAAAMIPRMETVSHDEIAGAFPKEPDDDTVAFLQLLSKGPRKLSLNQLSKELSVRKTRASEIVQECIDSDLIDVLDPGNKRTSAKYELRPQGTAVLEQSELLGALGFHVDDDE